MTSAIINVQVKDSIDREENSDSRALRKFGRRGGAPGLESRRGYVNICCMN